MTIGTIERRGGAGAAKGGAGTGGGGGDGGDTTTGAGRGGAGTMDAPQRRHTAAAGGFGSRHTGHGVSTGSCSPAAPGRRRRVGCRLPSAARAASAP